MNKDTREGTFIPCGDAMEKMEEIWDESPEKVSGGSAPTGRRESEYIEEEAMTIIPLN